MGKPRIYAQIKIMNIKILLILYYLVQLDFSVDNVTLFATTILTFQITTKTQNLRYNIRCSQVTLCFYLTKYSASILK